MSDERLRDAYAQALDRRDQPDRAGCADLDALLALVRREGREEQRLQLLDHVMSCSACRPELELLRAIERAGGEGARRTVGRLRWQRYATIALAASAAFALAVGPGRRLWDPEGDEVTRGSGDGVALVAPAADTEVRPGAPLTFAWRAMPGARRYAVEVLTPEGAVAAGGETADTTLTVTVPRAAGAGEYRWVVQAHAADGTTARSDARRLRVRRP